MKIDYIVDPVAKTKKLVLWPENQAEDCQLDVMARVCSLKYVQYLDFNLVWENNNA